jgi:type I restriction enzyme S subunit
MKSMTDKHKQKSLPEGWVWAIVDELARDTLIGLDRGRQHQSLIADGCPYFKMNNVTMDGRVIATDLVYVSASKAEQERFALRDGDVLFNTRNSLELVGKVGLVRNPPVNAVFNNNLMRIRFAPEVSPSFVCAQMCGPGFRNRMELIKRGTTNVAAVYAKNLLPMTVALPPSHEQQRIVAEIEKQFTRLDAAVEALKRVRANLKRYRASALKAACEGRLVPSEAERARAEGRDYEPAGVLLQSILKARRAKWEADELSKLHAARRIPKDVKVRMKYMDPDSPRLDYLPILPEGWKWGSVAQLGTVGEQPVLTGPFGTNLGREDFSSTGISVLTIGCLTNGGIVPQKGSFVSEEKAAELDRYRLRTGDLLFSRMASVGRAGLVGEKLNGALFNYHIMRLRLAVEVILPTFYLTFVRGAKTVVDYLREVNHGATRPGINTEQLLNMPVALPPLAEQHRIVAEVERRMSVIDALEALIKANLKRAERLRQSILKRAFEGKLVFQDPNDEPASLLLERIRAERAATGERAASHEGSNRMKRKRA